MPPFILFEGLFFVHCSLVVPFFEHVTLTSDDGRSSPPPPPPFRPPKSPKFTSAPSQGTLRSFLLSLFPSFRASSSSFIRRAIEEGFFLESPRYVPSPSSAARLLLLLHLNCRHSGRGKKEWKDEFFPEKNPNNKYFFSKKCFLGFRIVLQTAKQ